MSPDVITWSALLSACRWHEDEKTAVRAANRALALAPGKPSIYVTVANVMAIAGCMEDSRKACQLMRAHGLRKEEGFTWIEIDGKVASFLAHDRSHPQGDLIYSKLEEMSWRLKEAGYVPDPRFVLHDDEKHKEQLLCSHSEKLALAYGLLDTPERAPLHLVNNLRMCPDGQTATTLLSKLYSRSIVVQDANRFHHFANGKCSHGNYW